MLVERLPAALEEQGVARREGDLAWARPSPRRWTARMTRSPLGVIMPGKTVCPTRPERGGITTSARPEVRLNSASATSPPPSSVRKARCCSAASAPAASAEPRTIRVSPSATVGRRSGPPVRPSVIETRSSPDGMPCSIAARAAPTWPEDGRTRSWNRPSSSRYSSTRVRHGG
jgi:hypothetical protein